MAYLENIFPTDNSFKLQTRQNKFYFYDGFDSEDDDFNNDNNKQYILLDNDQNKQSNSLESFNQYIEIEAEALTAYKDVQQPAASKRNINTNSFIPDPAPACFCSFHFRMLLYICIASYCIS